MKTKYYIRFDDVCPTMNYDLFFRGIDLMKKYGIKPLLGVIPCNEDKTQLIDSERDDFWELIKKLKKEGYVIAMHGYKHVYDKENPRTLICGKKHSEFAGHSFEDQLAKIKKGKEKLESLGVFTDVFFAPGHTYDKNTLKALNVAGFKYMADSLSSKPYIQYGIKCLPCKSFGISQRIKGINVAVIHSNEWDMDEKKKDYDKLVDFCSVNSVCNYTELLNSKCGFYFFQKAIEKINVFINTIIKPFVHKCKKSFF